MFTSASIMKLCDMACRFLLCVLWLAVYPTVSQASPQTSERGSGYEEVLGRINAVVYQVRQQDAAADCPSGHE